MARSDQTQLPAPLIALAGWLLPGLGYFLIGEKKRAYVAGIAILLTFMMGLFIGGVRVIDVPGFDHNNQKRTGPRDTQWRLSSEPVAEVMNKPWYIAQSMVGPLNIGATAWSLSTDARQSSARIFDIGTLYTAVAGMLNLLVIIDAAYRATYPRVVPTPESTTQELPA